MQPDLFCKRQGKWTEIPYVQIFFQLRDMKELCLKYGLVVCPKCEPTRQMVLGIGNQEQEHPVKAHLPWLLSCLVLLPQGPNVPPCPGAPPPQKPTQLCPLVETGGEFGPTQVHKPLFLLGIKTDQTRSEKLYRWNRQIYIHSNTLPCFWTWCGRT